MKKFVCAAILTIAAVGVALADEFPAMIVKCDADKGCIEYKKVSGKGKDKKVDETAVKIDLAKNCKIVKGKFDKDAMKIVDGDPIEKGDFAHAASSVAGRMVRRSTRSAAGGSLAHWDNL